MNRTDENRQLKDVAGTERSPAASRTMQARTDAAGHSNEGDPGGKPAGKRGDDASMGRSPAAAHAGQDKEFATSESVKRGNPQPRKVSGGGSEAVSKSVDSNHVFGNNDSVKAEGAEGFSDDASAKANKKEAGEPEREAAEMKAVRTNEVRAEHTFGHPGSRGKEIATKNAMGHGQRETVGKNTI